MAVPSSKNEELVLAGGCFWCTEAVFKMIRGVETVEPGYVGGSRENPSYEQVSTGATGHAEAVKITYNPAEISVDDLLTVFFATHDPTTKDRQGNDVGSQYRSAIFYTTRAQKESAERFIDELNGSHKKGAPIVTEVRPLDHFWPAESYHQNYYATNPEQPYCQVVINPKLKKVQEKFATLLKNYEQ